MNKYWLIFFLLCLVTPISSFSVEPDEILADATLESRARVISKDLRCLVCQNENIDSSSADLARDLRLLVRERLVAGDSNEEVISYVVQRYGDFALLKPRFSGNSVILWSIGPLVLICSILFIPISFLYSRFEVNTYKLKKIFSLLIIFSLLVFD